MENCPYCGTPTTKTSFNRDFCPNHGIIEEPEEPEEVKKTPSYIN